MTLGCGAGLLPISLPARMRRTATKQPQESSDNRCRTSNSSHIPFGMEMPITDFSMIRIMEKSVIGISIPKGMCDEFDVRQGLLELSCGCLVAVLLILAGNEIGSSPAPHPSVIVQPPGTGKLHRKGETLVAPLFTFGFVLIGGYEKTAIE